MKPSKTCLLALAAFFGLTTAIVIPANSNDVPQVTATATTTTTTKDQYLVPFNMTSLKINPPFVVLHSSPPSPSPSQPPSHSHAKRTFGKPWKEGQRPHHGLVLTRRPAHALLRKRSTKDGMMYTGVLVKAIFF